MPISLTWPATPAAFLLWAQLLYVWFVVHYLLATDGMNTAPDAERASGAEPFRPVAGAGKRRRAYLWVRRQSDPDRHYYRQASVRILALVGIAGILSGFSWKSVPLLVAVAGLGAALLFGRSRFGDGYGLIASEIGLNAALVGLAGFLIGAGNLALVEPWIEFPVADERLAALFLVASSLIYLGKGGTYVVRGFLAVAGTMPRFEGEQKPLLRGRMEVRFDAERDLWVVDGAQLASGEKTEADAAAETGGAVPAGPDREFRRGRLIGNMERVVLALLALVGSYPAIGFLVTAKGLVRAKEFEDRDYAEYFLVGTLASTALALTIGTGLRLIVNAVWKGYP
jgi:hypothetical protein